MSEQYTVRLGDQDYGPVDLALLKTWRAEGRLLPETLVWKHRASEWVAYSTLVVAEDVTALVAPVTAPEALRGAEPTVALDITPQATPAGPSLGVAVDRSSGRAAAAARHADSAPHGAEVRPKVPRAVTTPIQSSPAPHTQPAHVAPTAAAHPAQGAPDSPTATPHEPARNDASGGGDVRSARPRPLPPVRRPPQPTFRIPLGWVIVAGIMAAMALAVVLAYSYLLKPVLERRRVVAEVRRKALPDRKLVDVKAGIDLALPNGWFLLPGDSSLVLDPGARSLFAHPGRGAFATLRMEEFPRLDVSLSDFATRQVAARRMVRPDAEASEGAEGRVAGQPSWKEPMRWTEEGAEVSAVLVVWRDAWRWYTLMVWAAGNG